MMQNKDYLLANKIIIEVENSDVFVAPGEKGNISFKSNPK